MQNCACFVSTIYFQTALRYNTIMLQRNVHSAKKIAVLGILTALALTTFLIENAFPPILGIPGAKMGLSNVFSLIALIIYSPVEGFIVVFCKTFLGALFQANFSSIIFSFAGGMVSMACSSVLLYCIYPKISFFSVSIVGAIVHNFIQNVIYVLETGVVENFSLLPYYSIIGIFSGAIVGGICLAIFHTLPKRILIQLER